MMVGDHKALPKTEPQAALPAPEQALDQAKGLIAKHPLILVGGALAAGALIGFLRSPSNGKKGLLSGMLGGLAMALVREAVMDRMSNYANSWIDMKSREETASRQRESDTLLQH